MRCMSGRVCDGLRVISWRFRDESVVRRRRFWAHECERCPEVLRIGENPPVNQGRCLEHWRRLGARPNKTWPRLDSPVFPCLFHRNAGIEVKIIQ